MDYKVQSIIKGFEILIKGLVQGVGFRPFIFRLAEKHHLNGEAENRTDGLSVIIDCDLSVADKFVDDIIVYHPPASVIKSVALKQVPASGFKSFTIAGSTEKEGEITEVSPDIAVCSECLDDMKHDSQRVNYPFVNCTNCGPRFTIIRKLPYDRRCTTMDAFEMCTNCKDEYADIRNRRFHAQPVACNSCGPGYYYKDPEGSLDDMNDILTRVAERINTGRSVAVKGMGGYFLMCDALNEEAVSTLRLRKQRDSKPFAVMFRDIKAMKEYCMVSAEEEKELLSWRRPIAILDQKKPLAFSVSCGLKTTGAMLPYMPVHYLLFEKFSTPAVVLTSGNLSEEPVIIEDADAEERLMPVTGALLKYNREIYNRADDSVIRLINDMTLIIRRSRGYVPRPVDVRTNVEGILAAGAEQKNCFCIGRGHQAIMSQHIGDLKNLPAYEFYIESVGRFEEIFRFTPEYMVCDMHPDYLSSKYAEAISKSLNIPLVRVQHHHAHIASCMAEYGIDEKVIGVSLDGTGYGIDGNIWGGEFMISDLADFERYTHFDYVRMPGGDKAVDEPWRMAFSYLHNYLGSENDFRKSSFFAPIEEHRLVVIKEMIEAGINSPLTSGAGRLFDAVSAITGLCLTSGFDSEAPMRLESVINTMTDLYYPFTIKENISFAETLQSILDDLGKTDISEISARFHNTIARVILEVCRKIRKETSLNMVVLSGGVFQNKYLTCKSFELLRNDKFRVFTNHLVPVNDGGIALGQLVIAAKRRELCV